MKIIISGTVGVGKTTTADNLTKHFLKEKRNVNFLSEISKNNPYLSLYYDNRPEWTFLIQMDFLFARFKSVMEEYEKQKVEHDRIAIFDRHFLDDKVFALLPEIREDMSNLLLQEYLNTNNHLSSRISANIKPDYFFLLKLPFEEVLNRIKERGNSYELNVAEEYWRALYDQYYNDEEIQEYFKENVKKFIILDINNLSKEEVVDKILEIIEN